MSIAPEKNNEEKKSKPKHKQYSGFISYIHKVLKQVHPGLSISRISTEQLNLFLIVIAKTLARSACELTRRLKKITVSSKEIQAAVKFVFPWELSKHSVSEGIKAVTKYNAARGDENRSNNKKKPERKERKCDLTFPIERCSKIIRLAGAVQVGAGAPVYLAAVLEYLCTEILQLAGNEVVDLEKTIIKSRHLFISIVGDGELNYLVESLRVEFAGSGVVPNIEEKLMEKKKRSKTAKIELAEGDKKAHRFRPGTVALREIKRYQKTTDLLLQKAPFERNFRKAAESRYEDIRFSNGVIDAIQGFVELRLTKVMALAQRYALDAGREGIKDQDIHRASITIDMRLLQSPHIESELDNIPNASIQHLARRAGVKRITASTYIAINELTGQIIGSLASVLLTEVEHMKAKTASMTMLRAALENVGYNYVVSDPSK